MPSFEVAPSKGTIRKGGTHPERGIAGDKASSATEGEKRETRKSDQSTPDEWVESWTSIEGMKGRRTRYLCVAYLVVMQYKWSRFDRPSSMIDKCPGRGGLRRLVCTQILYGRIVLAIRAIAPNFWHRRIVNKMAAGYSSFLTFYNRLCIRKTNKGTKLHVSIVKRG
jgi:hypothetical protein